MVKKKKLEIQGLNIDFNLPDEVYIQNEEGKLILLSPPEEEKEHENN